jgi:hypothetical protein
MVSVIRTASVGLVLTMAACGGDGNDREAFAREANTACRDLRREIAALPEAARYGESAKVYERELKRLQAIKPPDDLRARYSDMLRYKKEGLEAWREFVEHADRQDFKGGEPASDRATLNLVRAARMGSELHLADCDRALS